MRPFSLLCLLTLAACSGAPQAPLVANDIDVTRPLPGRHMSAAYLSLTNTTGNVVRITHVSSEQFASIEIHESQLQDGIARMRRIDELEIPAKSTVVLERGGKHLMLMRPREPADPISLSFFSGDILLLHIEAPLVARDN